VIELERVEKSFGGMPAVRGVSLTVAKGELVAIVGGSGSGKTTLLRMVNRLVEPDAGEVRVGGRDVRAEPAVALRRTIGYVIQHIGLLPHLTVEENIAMVPRLLDWTREAIASRVTELLDRVGLPASRYAARYPDELSGGQQQRVGIARALAAKPRVLLLDEPLGALDPITRVALQRELRAIHRDLGLTTLMVTHDIVEALSLADRVAVMLNGEIRQIATPGELVRAPADDWVAEVVEVARAQGETLRGLGQP
jgi:osmoprotectant transport system ATP-binding protein